MPGLRRPPPPLYMVGSFRPGSFRREEWKFGQREDWRYTKMAKDMPRLWPLVSFFAVGLAQLLFLLLAVVAPRAVRREAAWCPPR